MQCNFFDIFGLTSNDNYYKSRINLLDRDNYYPKDFIFKFDDKIFDTFLCFYENTQLVIELIEERKLDEIYSFKIKDDYSKKYSQFINLTREKNLFRFMSKKWALEAYFNGSFRVNYSLEYLKNNHSIARQDNEHIIKEKLDNCEIIHVKTGKKLNTFNEFKNTYDLDINSYILCFAYEYDDRLYEEFKADLCLVITDPQEFERKLNTSIFKYKLFSSRIYYNNDIHNFGVLFNKDRKYKIQKEFRFLWKDFNNPQFYSSEDIELGKINTNFLSEYIDIKIGSLEDISFLIDKEGKRVKT